MALYLIKQIPDDYSESTGLDKYNRSRMPGCTDVYQPHYDQYSGKYRTGLSVEEAKFYGEQLHRDLSDASEYWKDYSVSIYADEPRKFKSDNASDFVAYKMLLANGYVAPNKESIVRPEYRNTQYYAYTEEGELTENIRESKLRDKALSKLLSVEDNKELLILYGQFLEGIKYSDKLSVNTLYSMLRAYILDKDLQKAKNFLIVIGKSVEDLQKKIIIDKAIKRGVINFTLIGRKKRAYQFGQVTLGVNIEEVYENLAKADFAPELMAIKEELERK